ncbi:radical SAM protein [Clostridium sp. MB40-C1]|uniref:radical SAM protein n=1 Tax=Clostridium sp. MB40-C1 TaxID=3070996 RepID=UPI0027E16D12|nr:radical SAM protein [Clostridium sp. MB40-C1]WMJ79718.1 radical SAM protein [Clostridium sp. MB40-C1]
MSVKDTLEKNVKQKIMNSVVDIIEKNPEKNVERIFELLKKITKDKHQLEQIEAVHKYYDTQPATKELVHNILGKSDKKCLKKLVTNFFANANWYAGSKRSKYLDEEDTKIPFTMLISPTMQCNLRCKGCYAADLLNQPKMPIEEVDRIIGEARDLGIYWVIVLGGEPFFYKEMLDIYEKYPDMMFSPFTNGTLIDEELANRIKNLGNVVPMLSIEGEEEETDARRGKGTYKKVMHAMDLLNEKGVLFGVSTAVTRLNIDSVLSDKFVDKLIEKGSKVNWYFLFMPCGTKNPDYDLMLTPEQRIYLGKRTHEIRKIKPYFTMDFFNDAPFVGGCIAGKFFFHINVHGDCEPCIFAHFATQNIKNKHLIDIFRDPFFKELRHRQPYNKNMLRPCMMIDNPSVVREVCKMVGAKPTDEGGETMLYDEKFKTNIQKIADEWEPYADKAWKEMYDEKGNDAFSKG